MQLVGGAPQPLADRAALPAGVLTCLFTDIEGSTRLLRDLGPAFDGLLARHNALLRDAWRDNRGHEVKTIGDAFMVVFETAADAVSAAVAAQRALAAAEWQTELPVRIRIGMHTGYARPSDGDYTALVVHQAARVVGAARGGQILLTADTATELERTGVPDGADVHPLGRFRVRDFDEPVELHAATGPGVGPVRAPPRVRPADGHNLVRPITTLVGRRDDVDRLRELVGPGRVTTVVGPGGVGKTRLASETALDIASEWEDGAWFVDLAPVGDPALIGEAIGAAVGAPTAPGAERWPEVLEHLAERRLLVLLDNCEHLGDACARAVGDLLSACPGVGVLATSRGPLGLRGEQVQRLAPLPTAGADAAAVELFLQRSGDEQADRTVVAALVEELDGLPLAIEVAAARTTAVSVQEILRQVRRAPTALHSTDPTLPERQRSLERVLDWSWDLLSTEARTVLGRLAVFSGGFNVEAAEAVGAGGTVPPDDVPELLWTLIDASLVRPEDTEGATRYRLLATVRAHAASHADPAELAAARSRLASLLLARVGPARATHRSWVVAMELDLDNARGVVAAIDDDAAAQALAWSIGRYHDVKDRFRLGIEEIARCLDTRAAAGPDRVALLTLMADLHLRLGELEGAELLLEEATWLADSTGCPEWDDVGIARTRGELALRRDDPAAAIDEARRALSRDCSKRGQARLYNLLGIASAQLGDIEGAAAAAADEVRAATAAGLDTFLATARANLAEAHLTLGDVTRAAHHQRVSLGLAREMGQPVVMAFALMVAARLVDDARDAVLMQTKADEMLAEADYALYDEDQRVRSELLAATAAQLGAQGHEAAVAAGRAISLAEALDLAERTLTRVGSAPENEQQGDDE